MFGILKYLFGTQQERLLRAYKKIVAQVNIWEEKFQALSDTQIQEKTGELRKRHAKGESLDILLPEAYAVVKNACRRLVGKEIHVSGYDQHWDMVPYDVQILGAIAMHYGSIAEMQTGEGKTLTATMPLYLNALSGKSVHLVTVNDYLAQRDCEWMRVVFDFLGVTTAYLTNATPVEERKAVYAKDVVYGTASEFGFDYLRDNSSSSRKEDQVQEYHYFAIIDEVDSILIDEARTPLIISGPVSVSRHMYDVLKDPVASLVKYQRNLCNKLATEANRVLDHLGFLKETHEQAGETKDKKEREKIAAAFNDLWLVSKGTPHNRIYKRLIENPDIRHGIDNRDLYFHSDQNKQERIDELAKLYMVIDEKANEYELTDFGIQLWTQQGNDVNGDDFVMIDVSDEYIKIDEDTSLNTEEKMKAKVAVQEADAKRKERAHNLRQLLRAHLLMEKDIDYIVQDEKIVIIDENTGRPQPGRRFSDGLHQAIEAKENVHIQKETQTYASITLQNYFRMYDKLAGMTGTAITEAGEFKEIYKIEVLQIPTHVSCQRNDENDEIYMTEREKYHAILKAVKALHAEGRPVLLGTESVEVSEKLSRIFKQNDLPHTVLNARHHASEAEIIADAGSKGAITIATNMAGRGTDIKLKEGVASIGGLHVLGTTRHHSRRIDRQLRGRCARLGDPGSSKFYLCFEDQLMRLFGSPKWTALLKRLRPPEGEPISAGLLNKSIETAQKRVEQRNYMIRKHTLEYDDVMNKHRQEVYSFRNEILHAKDITLISEDLLRSLCSQKAKEFFAGSETDGEWGPENFRQWLLLHFPITFPEGIFDKCLDVEEIETIACEKVLKAFREKLVNERSRTTSSHPTEGEESFVDRMLRRIMITTLDSLWQEHLLVMDQLRTGVQMRAVGQKNPLLEFKQEAFTLFDTFLADLRGDIAKDLFKFEVVPVDRTALEQIFKQLTLRGPQTFSIDTPEEEPQEDEKAQPTTVVEEKVGRNDVCPCGSGKKYKKCCGIQQAIS